MSWQAEGRCVPPHAGLLVLPLGSKHCVGPSAASQLRLPHPVVCPADVAPACTSTVTAAGIWRPAAHVWCSLCVRTAACDNLFLFQLFA